MSLNLSFLPKPWASAPSAKNYVSNGYLANPTRSAQISANNAGALTRADPWVCLSVAAAKMTNISTV